MSTVGKFGKVRPATMAVWLEAHDSRPLYAARRRYNAWLVSLIRDAMQLDGWAACRLAEWLAATGRAGADWSGLQVVQYSLAECEKALGTSRQQAARFRDWSIAAGVLVPVHPGVRGHGALFAVPPLPPDSVTEKADGVTAIGVTEKADGVTAIGVTEKADGVTAIGVTEKADGVTQKNKKGNKFSDLGSQVGFNDLGKHVPIQSYPDIYMEGFLTWKCPKCGPRRVEAVNGGTMFQCTGCGACFPASQVPTPERPARRGEGGCDALR